MMYREAEENYLDVHTSGLFQTEIAGVSFNTSHEHSKWKVPWPCFP